MAGRSPLLVDFANLSLVRGDTVVLRDLNLQIRAGEHIAILGPNGCGKSTLIKAITRELYPLDRAGMKFEVLGKASWDVGDLRERFGIVALDLLHNLSNEVTLRRVTARELILGGFFNSVGLWPHHRVRSQHERRARAVLRFLDIPHLASRAVSEMSSGEQRRALIGRALAHDPQALILDEPTNSLDPGAAAEFRALLRKLAQEGRSLILVTHHIEDIIPEIDRVIMMKSGTLFADGSKKTTLTSRKVSELFGVRVSVPRR